MPGIPYLIDRTNAPLLASPPRTVAKPTLFRLFVGPLIIPGLLVAGGIWFVVEHAASDGFHLAGAIAGLVAFCAVALGFLAWGWSESRREYWLLRFGQIILGEVTAYSAITNTGSTEPTAGGGSSPWVQVTVTMEYAFRTPEGTRLTGKAVRIYTEEHFEPDVQPGDAMAVLYLDDKTYRVL